MCKIHLGRDKKMRTALRKRTQGLVQMASKLSKLCGIQVFLSIHDEADKKLTQYTSLDAFDESKVLNKMDDK